MAEKPKFKGVIIDIGGEEYTLPPLPIRAFSKGDAGARIKKIQHAFQQQDPPYVVIDEWVGMWIALMPLASVIARDPFASWQEHLVRCAIPFSLFRLFDIWKPGPIGRAQKLGGVSGVMVDDVLAGLGAALLAKPLLALSHRFFIH